jgi:hypothetical protein
MLHPHWNDPKLIELKPGAQTLKTWLVASAQGKTPA